MTHQKNLFLILLLIPYALYAIHDPTTIGARSISMGNISVVGTDFHSLYHNQAAMAYYGKSSVGLDYDQGFFADKNLSTKSVGAIINTGIGSLGVQMKYFGFQLYNEQKVGLAYGRKLGKYLAIGVQLDYFRTYIGQDYGNAQALSFEIGFYSKLSEKLELGAHILNPIGMTIGNEFKESLPIGFKFGLLYHIDENLLIACEVEKTLTEKAIYKFGLEYLISNYFSVRTGLSTQPTLFSFGMGLNLQKWHLDVGTAYHQNLGFTPRISLYFNFD